MKRFVICLNVLFLIMLCFMLSGCWDYAPLENKYAVSGIAIDLNPDKASEFNITTIGISNTLNDQKITASGRTVAEGMRKLQDHSMKIVALSHLQVILISEEVAKSGISFFVDIMIRDVQIRDDAFLIVVKGKAADYFDKKNFLHDVSGVMFQNAIRYSETQINLSRFQMHDIISKISNQHIDFVLPILNFDSKQKLLEWSGLTVFRNAKQIVSLSPQESFGFFLLSGVFERGQFTSKGARTNPSEEVYTIRFQQAEREMKCQKVDGRLQFTMDFQLEDQLVEVNPWNSESIGEQKIKMIENKIEDELKQQLETVFRKIQQTKSEPFDFQQTVRLCDPDYQADLYRTQFSRAKLTVSAKIRLNEMGHLY